jgi:hypothetical protein
MLGDWLESVFSKKLVLFAEEHDVYCDRKGLRPLVRGNKKKVTWLDNGGNEHDLDFVIEKNGSDSTKGEPAAFVELCWRRYTKHSRNKAGEIEGSLVHLGDTYNKTCTFLGAILVGEFTEGAIKQMRSRKIEVLHIPYESIVEAFRTKDIDLDYSEDAPDTQKLGLINAIKMLSDEEMGEVEQAFILSIEDDYQEFVQKLANAISRKVQFVRIFRLFGNQVTFPSVAIAIKSIEEFTTEPHLEDFQRFEIYIGFTNGDKVEASFKERRDAVAFLRQFE